MEEMSHPSGNYSGGSYSPFTIFPCLGKSSMFLMLIEIFLPCIHIYFISAVLPSFLCICHASKSQVYLPYFQVLNISVMLPSHKYICRISNFQVYLPCFRISRTSSMFPISGYLSCYWYRRHISSSGFQSKCLIIWFKIAENGSVNGDTGWLITGDHHGNGDVVFSSSV